MNSIERVIGPDLPSGVSLRCAAAAVSGYFSVSSLNTETFLYQRYVCWRSETMVIEGV